jgi:hypothetical protein
MLTANQPHTVQTGIKLTLFVACVVDGAVVGAALEACAVAGEFAKGLDLFDKLMQERNTGNKLILNHCSLLLSTCYTSLMMTS